MTLVWFQMSSVLCIYI